MRPSQATPLGVPLGAALIACALAWHAPPADARITAIELQSSEPFAGGRDFGAGPYLRIQGRARGELDPADPRNAVIADLDRAPRNARGMVEYATEITILRPADAARANGRLLHEVTNRGRKLLFSYLHDTGETPQGVMNSLSAPEAVGNGIALRLGYSMVWNGWDTDVPRGGGNLRIELPEIPGLTATIRDEFVFGMRINPADRPTAPLSYPAADTDQGRARLTIRRTRDEAPREVPREAWAYAGEDAIRLLPEGTRFEPFSIYELTYPARGARPLGMGYAATRDLASFLRHAPPADPGRRAALGETPVRAVLAIGISQSGRYLRHHLDLGMNADEQGRRVFDGMLVHIAGAGRVFANERFAQPNRTATWHEDHAFPENWFPLAHAEAEDPSTGRRGALLRGDGTDPLILEVNTSTEYWQKGASLIHTDPAGRADLPEPAGVRHYLVAGTKHGGRAGLSTARGVCANPNNPHASAPLLRALLAALDAWVTRGEAPPASRVPRLADGTLVPAEQALRGFPRLAGVALPRFATPVAPVQDWVAGTRGPEETWRPLVPALDADGNERAGVRLPDIAAPRGTYTGWNLYRAEDLLGEPCDREGSFLPFAATRTEGDPRPSLAERYPNPAAYLAAVRGAAEPLVAARLLLPEDAAAMMAAAERDGPVPPR